MNNQQETRFIDTETAFMECFTTDKQRSKFMYMYSKGDTHYFKDIISRQYTEVVRVGLV